MPVPAALAVLLLVGAAHAASISSATCTGSDTSGCVTSYIPTSPALVVQISGTWDGTIEFLGSHDGTAYTPLRGYPVVGGPYETTARSNGAWTVVTGGLKYVRLLGQAWVSGTAEVSHSPSTSAVTVDVVRATGLYSESLPVSGTISLTQQTLNSIAGPTCIPSDILRIAVSATPTLIPVISSTRTEVTIRNVSVGAISLSCRPDISGLGDLPDCNTPGYGLTINPVESVTFSYRASVAIRCRTCPAGGGVVEHMEVSCTG